MSINLALALAQAEVENATKNAQNPHLKNKYANLEGVLDVGKPVLAKHNLSVVTMPGRLDGNGNQEFTTTLRWAPTEETKDSDAVAITHVFSMSLQKADPQGTGSAITYARRYAMACWLNITQEDDDGNAASGPKKATRATSPASSAATLDAARVIKAFTDATDPKQFQEATKLFTQLQPGAQADVIPHAKQARTRCLGDAQ